MKLQIISKSLHLNEMPYVIKHSGDVRSCFLLLHPSLQIPYVERVCGNAACAASMNNYRESTTHDAEAPQKFMRMRQDGRVRKESVPHL